MQAGPGGRGGAGGGRSVQSNGDIGLCVMTRSFSFEVEEGVFWGQEDRGERWRLCGRVKGGAAMRRG